MIKGDKFAAYFLEVSKGNVPGHSSLNKFGDNPDIDITSGFEDIWDGGGIYVPPTFPQLHDVVSTAAGDTGTVISAGTASETAVDWEDLIDSTATFISDGVLVGDTVLNDTGMELGSINSIISETQLHVGAGFRDPTTAELGNGFTVGQSYRVVNSAGLGAATIYIQGLSQFFTEQSEFVVMNGLTPVSTVGLYARQFRARVFGNVGVGALGLITSTAATDLTVSCQVMGTANQSLMAIYTVPINKDAYIYQWWGSLSKKQAGSSNLILRGGFKSGFGYIQQSRSLNSTGSSAFNYLPVTPIRLGPGLDIWVEADSDSNNMGISSGFDLILVDNEGM